MKNKRIIKENHKFQSIILKNHNLKSKYFVAYYNLNEFNHIRYGISVGKKIGNAVLRNFIKRQIRNLFYNNLNNFKDISVDIILISKSIIKDAEYKNIESDFVKLINKIIKTSKG